MSAPTACDHDELKLIYRVLHANLRENLALLDSDFFCELQALLQALARLEGVDVSDHARWDAWLDQRHVPRSQRNARRRQLHA